MQANRPANPYSFIETHRNVDSGKEPLTIKAGLIMSLTDSQTAQDKSDTTNNIALVSCLMGCLKQYKEEKKFESKLQDLNQGHSNESI
jgi:hypothetical protein